LKLEKTAKLREDKLKTRKEDLKFFHTKHKEKVQAKVQVLGMLIVGRQAAVEEIATVE
jgi:hypothetical protein